MSENKFTPGKWIYVRNKEQNNPKTGRLILQDKTTNSKNIASVIPCIGMKQEEIEANAKLIAAAPDMLEALLNLENDDHSIPDHAWKMIAAAINKATA